MVRAFLGLSIDTGNMYLTKADVLMRAPSSLELAGDPDAYLAAVEVYTNAVAAADGLSYNAR